MYFQTERVTRMATAEAASVLVYVDTEAIEVLDLAVRAANCGGPDFYRGQSPQRRAFGLLAATVGALIYACRPAHVLTSDLEQDGKVYGGEVGPHIITQKVHRGEVGQLIGVTVRMNYAALIALDLALAAARFVGPDLYRDDMAGRQALRQLTEPITVLSRWMTDQGRTADGVQTAIFTPPAAEEGGLQRRNLAPIVADAPGEGKPATSGQHKGAAYD